MAALNFEHTSMGRAFWLRWVLVNITGVVVGIALMFTGVGVLLDETPLAVFGAGLGTVFGTTLGIGQWLVLRRYLDGIGAWVPLTIVSWIVFWALNIAGAFPEGEGLAGKAVEGIWHGLVFGVLGGVAQSIALRGRVNGAGWWAIINGVCWSLSAAAGDAGNFLLGNPGGADLLIAFLLACGLTELGMMWLPGRSLGLPRRNRVVREHLREGFFTEHPRGCYELGRNSHTNADSTVDLVPLRSPFPAFLSRF